MTMGKETNIEWKPIWWASIFFTLFTVILDGLLRIMDKNINKTAYNLGAKILNQNQPDYFPLVFLVVMFAAAFIIVWVYRLLLPNLPQILWLRGIAFGLGLFFVVYLPLTVYYGFIINLPKSITTGRIFTGLINYVINGCILAYSYYRFSSEYKKD